MPRPRWLIAFETVALLVLVVDLACIFWPGNEAWFANLISSAVLAGNLLAMESMVR